MIEVKVEQRITITTTAKRLREIADKMEILSKSGAWGSDLTVLDPILYENIVIFFACDPSRRKE